MDELEAEQRRLFRRWPSGVSVVVAEADGQRAGLTVSSLLSLSLHPPLVGVSIAHDASLFPVINDVDEWGVSILSGGQEHIARRFAASTPPMVLWEGIEARADDERLLADAVGWIVARTVARHLVGDHTIFVGEIIRLEQGSAPTSLVHRDQSYSDL